MNFKDFFKTFTENLESVAPVAPVKPSGVSGSPLFDLTKNGTYPNEFYQSIGRYKTGETGENESAAAIMSNRGKQNGNVQIYKAVPKYARGAKIGRGDVVSLSKAAATEHGVANLQNRFTIISRVAKARDLFNNGENLVEWTYNPQPEDPEHRKTLNINRLVSNMNRVQNGEKISGINKGTSDQFYNNGPGYILYAQKKLQELNQQQ